jgi:coenzyme PQQ precursor peptide PqqA
VREHLAAIRLISQHPKEHPMIWTTPKVTEIAVGMEINCYACAEIAG